MPNENIDLPPPVNHVFVDYENVHTVDPTIIGSKTVHVTLLLGAQKTKLDATVVEKLVKYPETVDLTRLKSSGRNAVDFTLVYYLGRAVQANPCGHFYIISKDTDFDPLIEHLRTKRICVCRHHDFSKLNFSADAKPPTAPPTAAVRAAKPPAKPVVSKSPPPVPTFKPPPKAQSPPPVLDDDATKFVDYLRKIPDNRPKLKTALRSHVMNYFHNKFAKPDVERFIERLRKSGYVKVNANEEITYPRF